jgi:hypothetical protein
VHPLPVRPTRQCGRSTTDPRGADLLSDDGAVRSLALEIVARLVWRLNLHVGDIELSTRLVPAADSRAQRPASDRSVASLSRLLAGAMGDLLGGVSGFSLQCAVSFQGDLVEAAPTLLPKLAPPSATADALAAVAEQCAANVASASSHSAFHAALDSYLAVAHCAKGSFSHNTSMVDR